MTATVDVKKQTQPATQIVNRVLLSNISWQTYEALVRDLEAQPGTRLTYDRGMLEIMTPLIPHEKNKKLIGRLVENLTAELDIEICSLGSLTCKREDLKRGLEPDQCYYIQNELVVRNLSEIDFTKDPPPDLAIEIDITSSSLNRMEIYANLGVPELWHYDGKSLKIYQLEGNQYQECQVSSTLPQLPPAEVMGFLELKKTMGETSWIRSFRQWVRSQIQAS
ncbi:MAG: Uma2 family endonuclease [Xenococcaceae cyanobacterium]